MFQSDYLDLLIIWLLLCPYYSMAFYSMMCMHRVWYVHRLQCNQLHKWLHISVRATTFVGWTLHFPCWLCTKTSAPCKWTHHLYTFSGNSNNLPWCYWCTCHQSPLNGMHSTINRLDALQLPVSCELYLLAIVCQLKWSKREMNRID